MASVSRTHGRVTIQFKGPDGKRRSLRLGKVDERTTQEIKGHVEYLAGLLSFPGPIAKATAEWLSTLLASPGTAWLYDRMAAVGLVAPRPEVAQEQERQEQAQAVKLGPFLQEYVARRTDAKPATRINWSHTIRNLLGLFGPDKLLSEFTVGDARDFERYLKTTARELRYGDAEKADGLKPATLRKRISNAKQFFEDAVERELIPRNPFAKFKAGVKANRDRDFFITLDMAEKVLESCPDDEWRALFALARFCALRTPSETLLLRWQDVDWERGRLLIHSPKTEHHEGKATRIIPMFPEVRPILERLFDAAPDGAEYVITRYRRAEQNLRTTLTKIVHRAGLTMWPKAFQNLRASCETELMQRFPSHVVLAWIGHTQRIAQEHYLQVTDADFAAALQGAGEAVHVGGAKSGAAGAFALAASDCMNGEETGRNPGKIAVSQGFTPPNLWATQDSNL